MLKIILASHGKFSEALYKSGSMIIGEQDYVRTVTFMPGEGLDDLLRKYENVVNELGKDNEILFLVDLFGGSPFNAASTIVIANDKYELVTGMNLPMYLELVGNGEDISLEDAKQIATNSGKEGIINFEKNIEDDEEEEF
ncbi:PTS sugar transporter subunit IIA [uncultured Clostridium sp.]|uniref:PTS sugar transporter subunit IIA n=1 Tax=uncultured Clostridium sp. TaxID=59620 RepID=UPI00260B3A54|nr:PTS sugar transporter subunit IIA [uncultured Clostridium sp.]